MFKELYGLMAPQAKALLLVVFIGGLASLATVGLMGLAGWLIASAALMPPLYTLSLAITGVRFCGIFRAVFRYLERLLSHKVGFAFFNLYRQRVLASMVDLVPFKVKAAEGNVYHIMVDAVDKMRDAFLRFFLPPLTALLMGLVLVLFFGMYSWLLSFWLLLLTLLFLIVLPYWAKAAYDKLPGYEENLTQEIMEMYEGNLEMSVYGYTAAKLAKSEGIVNAYQNKSALVNRVKAKVALISELVTIVSLVASLVLIIYLYNVHSLNGVWCVTVMLVIQALLDIYVTVPGLMQWVWESEKAYGLLARYLFKPQQVEESKQVEEYDQDSYLASHELGFGYGDNVLSNLSIQVEKGDKVLILGASGVGKSTFCYVLTKLLNYNQGSLGFGNLDYAFWSGAELRRHFSPSFQDHHIFAGTVRENFKLLHPDISDQEILAAFKTVGSTIFKSLADLDRQLMDNGGNVSGGQRHGLQLAMVLARAKEVILLDEPTAGLDLQTASHLLASIMKDYTEHTIIISSHDLSLLKYFTKVIILGNNRIMEQGEISLLLADESSQLNKLVKYKNLV